ncbi:Uncharacterised protein [Klebsiella pneumoniae]|nr:Uncharacterised protein [Klebsiella pneumoniae]
MTQARRPSPLQRRVLIVLAALDAKRPGPVATRDIERVLEQGRDAPVYGPNLRPVAALQNRSSRQNARLKRHDND